MIRIQDSKKQVISIGHYKILEILHSDETKDLFHVQDLKTSCKEYMLRILKSNQNPKQIDNEIAVLNLLNPYKETINFLKLEIFSDKLLFVFDYAKGDNLEKLYAKNHKFFTDEKIKLFISQTLRILEIYKENNIIHRNINPKTIICSENKYFFVGLNKAIINKNNKSLEDRYSFISVLYFLITGKILEIELNDDTEYKMFQTKIYAIIKEKTLNLKKLKEVCL